MERDLKRQFVQSVNDMLHPLPGEAKGRMPSCGTLVEKWTHWVPTFLPCTLLVYTGGGKVLAEQELRCKSSYREVGSLSRRTDTGVSQPGGFCGVATGGRTQPLYSATGGRTQSLLRNWGSNPDTCHHPPPTGCDGLRRWSGSAGGEAATVPPKAERGRAM